MISNPHRPSRSHSAVLARLVVPTLVAALGVCGCQQTKDLYKGNSRIEVRHDAHSQAKSKVQVLDVHLEPGPDGGDPASIFQLTLRNTKDKRLWVRLLTTSPRLSQSCENAYGLDEYGTARVECPQKLATDGAFTLELTVYKDIGQTHVVERARLNASFGPDGVAVVEWE